MTIITLNSFFSTLKHAPYKNYNRSGGFVPVFQYRILIRDCCIFYRAVSKCFEKTIQNYSLPQKSSGLLTTSMFSSVVSPVWKFFCFKALVLTYSSPITTPFLASLDAYDILSLNFLLVNTTVVLWPLSRSLVATLIASSNSCSETGIMA